MRNLLRVLTGSVLAGACAATQIGDTGPGASPPECYEVALPDSLRGNFAGEHAWFVGSAAITVQEQRYLRFGYPRSAEILERNGIPARFVLFGSYDGVPAFAEQHELPEPSVIYMPVDEACIYQAYTTPENLR